MGDQPPGNPGNLPAPQGGDGPPPVKRLPDGTTTEGPKITTSSTSSVSGDTASGSATASSQLGSYQSRQGGTTSSGRVGFADASASGSVTRTTDGYTGSGNASVAGGLLTGQGNSEFPGGLGNVSTKGRVMAGDLGAEGTFKLSREEATLSGKLGGSAVLYEVQAKGELVLTPQRLYNGIIVNGVNAFAEWRGYSYRMKDMQNAALDKGIILSGNVGAHIGPAFKAEGHGSSTKDGTSFGGSITASPIVGGTLGGSVGWKK